MSGRSSPDEAKALSTDFPHGMTPDDVLVSAVSDALLLQKKEHKPALRELITLAQACMSMEQS